MKPAPKNAIQGDWQLEAPGEEETVELPPLSFDPPLTVEELLEGGPSELGLSVVSGFMACPESARLRAIGVRPKRSFVIQGIVEPFDELGFGSLFHAVIAVRSIWGQDQALDYLKSLHVSPEDEFRAVTMLKSYDYTHPLGSEPFEYLGVEVLVRTNIQDRESGKLFRTVRYDKIVRFWKQNEIKEWIQDDGVYSLELKTASKNSESVVRQYGPQRMVQAAVWNRNEALVAKYGHLKGVIFDVIEKSGQYSASRYGPMYVTKREEVIAVDYLRLPEAMSFPVNSDGSYPRFIHNCYGRYRPCKYIPLCWENSVGLYSWPKATEPDPAGDSAVVSAFEEEAIS